VDGVVLVAVATTACHPRYVPLDERGVGGSGGLDSIRTRILAAIAVRDYQHARDLLELAEGFTQQERDRVEWAITAAERGLAPFLEGALPHIFKADPGHFAEDTAEARELIQTTATKENFVRVQELGFKVYQRILDTGVQVWCTSSTERSGMPDTMTFHGRQSGSSTRSDTP
jgi:hypothetical protein